VCGSSKYIDIHCIQASSDHIEDVSWRLERIADGHRCSLCLGDFIIVAIMLVWYCLCSYSYLCLVRYVFMQWLA
jgi:hypothetical protein